MFRISLRKEGLPAFVLTSKWVHRERGPKEAGRTSVSVFEMVTIRRRKSVKATHIACREGGDTIYPIKSLTQHNMESVKYIYQYFHLLYAFWVESTSVGGGGRIVVKWYHVDSKLITSLWNDTNNSEVSRVRISATTESQVPVNIFFFPFTKSRCDSRIKDQSYVPKAPDDWRV